MKKLLLILYITLAGTLLFAQPVKKVWTVPSAYNLNEKVTIYVDIAGTAVESVSGDLYYWTWGNGVTGDANWDSSAEAFKWEKVDGTTFVKKTFENGISSVYPEAALGGNLTFLLKTQDGSSKTDDITFQMFDWGKASSKILSTFPEKFNQTDNVSILLNVTDAYGDGGNEQGQLVGATKFWAHTGVYAGGWQNVQEYGKGYDDKIEFKKLGTSGGKEIWKLDMVPQTFYDYTDKIEQIALLARNEDWSKSARGEGGKDMIIEVGIPTGPVEIPFYTFPSKFNLNDIVTLYFNTKLLDEGKFKNVDKTKLKVKFLLESTSTQKEVSLKYMGLDEFKVSFQPKLFFEIPDANVNAGSKIKIKITDGTLESEEIEIEAVAIN